MARYDVAECIYSMPDLYIAKILSVAISGLNALDDRTPMEDEALKYALRLEMKLQKEPDHA